MRAMFRPHAAIFRRRPLSLSKQAVAYCWHSPALVSGPIGTHDHIFVFIYNPYGIRRWASSSVSGGVVLINAAGLCQLLYLGLPLVSLSLKLLHCRFIDSPVKLVVTFNKIF
jgi:hypothetical protein